MTSRLPPSRRDPSFAPQRAAKVVSQQTPGAGRVAGVSQQPVSEAVAAALRGRPGATSGPVVIPVLHGDPTDPPEGMLWFNLDATC